MRTYSLAFAFVLVISITLSGVAHGQPADGASPQSALKDHPVSKLVGEWRGSGWAMQPDRSRVEFDVVERVRWNLSGTAMIVEGFGFSHDPETGELRVGHDAFALVAWDEESETVKFHARRVGEEFQTYDMIWDPERESLVWYIQPDRVRFIITIKDGVWREVGEFSPDGGVQWMPFLDMSLTAQEG